MLEILEGGGLICGFIYEIAVLPTCSCDRCYDWIEVERFFWPELLRNDQEAP